MFKIIFFFNTGVAEDSLKYKVNKSKMFLKQVKYSWLQSK